MVIQEASPQRDIHTEAAALLRNRKIPNTIIPLVRNPSIMSLLRRMNTRQRGFDVRILDYSHRDNIGNLVVFNQAGSRVYASDGNKDREGRIDPIVYSSEEEKKPASFVNTAGFLDTKVGKKVEFDHEKAANIALYGTINANLNGGSGQSWMEYVTAQVRELTQNNPEWPEGVSVFNPNTRSDVQAKAEKEGFDMEQFGRESHNLFGAPVVVMNFEPKGGGIALAELRMAMLASILTGNKLIVRMEEPDMTNINAVRSRAVAEADIEFFQHKFAKRLSMDFYPPGALSLEDLAGKAVDAYKIQKGHAAHSSTYQVPHRPSGRERIVLSGSSANARDMAIRLEVKQRLYEKGRNIVDTYSSDFGGNALSDMSDKMDFMKASRIKELEEMMQATHNLVYAGEGSLSQFGQVTTALLFAALNGSRVHVLLGEDSRDLYDGATYRSHSARMYMNYAMAKILHLNDALKGVSPELGDKIVSISDRIHPVIKSFQGSLIGSLLKKIQNFRKPLTSSQLLPS